MGAIAVTNLKWKIVFYALFSPPLKMAFRLYQTTSALGLASVTSQVNSTSSFCRTSSVEPLRWPLTETDVGGTA